MNPTPGAFRTRLFTLLARLFPGVAASVLLISHAGIQAGRIYAEDKPFTRWYFIVTEADKAGRTSALVEAAMRVYPGNAELVALHSELVGEGT